MNSEISTSLGAILAKVSTAGAVVTFLATNLPIVQWAAALTAICAGIWSVRASQKNIDRK